MITLNIKCEKHPEYKAVQRPRAACAACMHLYKLREMVKQLPVHNAQFCNQQWDGSELHFDPEGLRKPETKVKALEAKSGKGKGRPKTPVNELFS